MQIPGSNGKRLPIQKVISGGQTGVDRAALDAALACGIDIGGWCPLGRVAEDGVIDGRYALRETPSPDTNQRTTWNVRDSDATLVILYDKPSPGTSYTIDTGRMQRKYMLLMNIAIYPNKDGVWQWIEDCEVQVLNVAGPRESEAPGVYQAASDFLKVVFAGA